MKKIIDREKTIEIIEKLKLARIGDKEKLDTIIMKIRDGKLLKKNEEGYFRNLTRIYKGGSLNHRSKIYHIKLLEHDEKPLCSVCSDKSLYYCNMNDVYLCSVHVVGHDENEV
jgi:hypothetical protein